MKEELLSRLDALSEKLGVASEHVWGVLIKQSQIVAWEYIAYAIIVLAVSVILFVCARKIHKTYGFFGERAGWGKDSEEPVFIGTAVLVGIAFACFAWATYLSRIAMTYMLNPDMYALEQIKALFK